MKATSMKVRIALAVGSNHHWAATGYSDMEARQIPTVKKIHEESVLEPGPAVVKHYWVEVEVPVPQADEIVRGKLTE